VATMRDRLARTSTRSFVGRADVLDDISLFLLSHDKMVYNVTGVSGIGKTWLLRELSGRAKAKGWRVVAADINVASTPTRFLESAAEDLVSQGVNLASYAKSREILDKLSQVVNSALDSRAGAASSVIDTEEVHRAIYRILGMRDAAIYLRAEAFLTDAFLQDLAAVDQLAILIDTFEKISGSMEHWIREELLRNLTESARIVISGQGQLGSDWSDWFPFTVTRELENFNSREMTELISASGADTKIDVANIMALTGGYPLAAGLYVATSASANPALSLGSPGDMSVTDAVVSRMLRGIDNGELRRLLYAVAGFPVVNRELAAIAIDADISDSLWRAFTNLSFVRSSQGGFELHDVVQRFVSEAAARDEPYSARERHRRAAAYWLRRGNQELYIFHLALADADSAIREARQYIRFALSRGDIASIQSLIARVEGVGNIVPRMFAMGSLFRAVRASVKGDWKIAASEALRINIENLDSDIFAPSRLLACEAMRYQGELADAARMALEGLEFGAGVTRSTTQNPIDTLCELRMQLVELDGLRGLQVRARESLAMLDRELAGRKSSLYLRVSLLFQQEHLARWQGEWMVALKDLNECLQILKAEDDVDPFLIARLEYGFGRVLTYSGWFTSARTMLDDAELRFRDIGRRQHLGEALVGKAIVARETGRADDSAALLGDAREVFREGHSVLYESWVHANELRLSASIDAQSVDLAEALRFAAECGRIEYRHGQGHALFTADVHDEFRVERALDCFTTAGMRFEALEASVHSRIAKQQPASDLAMKAFSSGDYWTAARAEGVAQDWLAYDRVSGPQTPYFTAGAPMEIILGQARPGLRVEVARTVNHLVGDLYDYTGIDSPGHN
jgi:hypothetical protein